MLATIESITRNMVCKPKQGLFMQMHEDHARKLGDIPEVWQDNQNPTDATMNSQIHGYITRVNKI